MATKTKTKKKTTVNPDDLAIIAGQNAVTYGPQINQIRDLTRQADEQYRSDIEAAKSGAKSAIMYASNAIPTVGDIFNRAKADEAKSHKLVTAVVGVPTANDPFSRALASEAEGQRNRTSTSRTGALTELQNRITGAAAGKQLAITQAKSARSKTRGLLSQKLQDILQEQGAVTSANLTTMRSDRAAARAKTRLEQDKLNAKDQTAADKAAAEKAKAKQKHQTEVHSATSDFTTRIENAMGTWDQYAKKTAPKTEIKEVGGKQVEQVVMQDGKPVMEPITPSEVKDLMLDAGYTPGEVHIALLRRVGKPMDAAAMRYLRGLKGKNIRIPRAWLPAQGVVGAAPLAPSGPGSTEMRPT
jgi:hypothetical protein